MKTIPNPGFAGDSGATDPIVSHALAQFGAQKASYFETLAQLQLSRILVPVVAILGEVEVDEAGLTHDKTSDMAAVLLQKPDGRKALVGFTGMETLQAWDSQARPVPVSLADAAKSALQEGASALVLDVAGPYQFAIGVAELTELAAGNQLAVLADRWAWVAQATGTS